MSKPHLVHLPLVCHPGSPSEAVRGIDVMVQARDGVLELHYRLQAEMARIKAPTLQAPRRMDELWRHTCFEAFILDGAGPGYLEWNFSPSTAWAAYRFESYRQGMRIAEAVAAPEISSSRTEQHLELAARVFLPPVPPTHRLALSAVIEEEGGQMSYWALRHPPGKADFHHPEGFVLEL